MAVQAANTPFNNKIRVSSLGIGFSRDTIATIRCYLDGLEEFRQFKQNGRSNCNVHPRLLKANALAMPLVRYKKPVPVVDLPAKDMVSPDVLLFTAGMSVTSGLRYFATGEFRHSPLAFKHADPVNFSIMILKSSSASPRPSSIDVMLIVMASRLRLQSSLQLRCVGRCKCPARRKFRRYSTQ